jgi:hypothetical protein
MIIAAVVLVGGVGIGLALTGGIPSSIPSPSAGPTIDGIPCNLGGEVTTYHVHSHFEILVNGKPEYAPAGVGIVGAQFQNGFASGGVCFYWLHVHLNDGIIHEEAPGPTHFTLGQFFDIWREPLSHSQVANQHGPVTYYMNGQLYRGDPRSISLEPHAVIVAEVGTPVVPPPPFTDWLHSRAGG